MNLRSFGDFLVWVSILLRKRLDLRHVLEVQFGRKGFGYLDIREWPINLYSVLLSYCNTKYLILKLFGDRLVWVLILVRKRLDLGHVLEVQYDRKGSGYLDLRERPISLYSVLSLYWNTKYWIWEHLEIFWSGFQSCYVKG